MVFIRPAGVVTKIFGDRHGVRVSHRIRPPVIHRLQRLSDAISREVINVPVHCTVATMYSLQDTARPVRSDRLLYSSTYSASTGSFCAIPSCERKPLLQRSLHRPRLTEIYQTRINWVTFKTKRDIVTRE